MNQKKARSPVVSAFIFFHLGVLFSLLIPGGNNMGGHKKDLSAVEQTRTTPGLGLFKGQGRKAPFDFTPTFFGRGHTAAFSSISLFSHKKGTHTCLSKPLQRRILLWQPVQDLLFKVL